MHRFTMPAAAAAIAGALLLAGCASTDGSSEASSCDVIKVEVRDISNGAQNTLAAESDPAALSDYLSGLSERVTTLEGEAPNDDVKSALGDLSTSIENAAGWADEQPTPDPEAEEPEGLDADGIAAQQESIQAAAVKVTEVCTTD
ncbi:hypothetical protein FLP10_07010 [Agromyces intestinalis]|uniref:Secreted protein n=1 Tax=Agromyces intestinalis TaxID=2592652 RepID=A0A5C1YDR7_9MICO|nr:hypothetical protein [Agromyces intestinalis]QEO14194.1 hypothetical protein FLP10_07010 [Agromyces intestinalis]